MMPMSEYEVKALQAYRVERLNQAARIHETPAALAPTTRVGMVTMIRQLFQGTTPKAASRRTVAHLR